MRILIANRGEIARRIVRSARALGHGCIAVYSDADAGAPFTAEADAALRIGPAAPTESYLSMPRLLAAAEAGGADAVHPGYGFLSENAEFARAVIDAGLTWVGPHPEAMAAMGDKASARRIAAAADVPTVPGFDGSQDLGDLRAAAAAIGFPVLVKAAGGGGGKGIRIAARPEALEQALAEAAAEAERSFGNPSLILERFVEAARHVEVQVAGDRHGTVIELGSRECSLQRRYQKVLEEGPAPCLPDGAEAAMRAAALRLAGSVGYDSVGTVEFVLDDRSGEFFFMEMNTRLQVEHPVTEAITGVDLVALQLAAAAGEPLPVAQDEVRFTGHAFEARINAEDACRGFAPQTGTVSALAVPDGVRWDAAIEPGTEITPHYDPMIAKLIVHGADRETARRRLTAALDQLLIGGVTTNGGFQRWLADTEPVRAGRVTTRFLDEAELPTDYGREPAAAAAAAAWQQHLAEAADASSPWSALGKRHFTPHAAVADLTTVDADRTTREFSARELAESAGTQAGPSHVDVAARQVTVNIAGQSHTFDVPPRIERWAPAGDDGHGHSAALSAPFPAVVTEVAVTAGDEVAAGDPLVVIEAMKMLHTLAATGTGRVAEVRVSEGDQVSTDQVLVVFADPQAADSGSHDDSRGDAQQQDESNHGQDRSRNGDNHGDDTHDNQEDSG